MTYRCDKCKQEWDAWIYYDLEDDRKIYARNLAIHKDLIAEGLWKEEWKTICENCYLTDYSRIKNDYLNSQKPPAEKCSQCGNEPTVFALQDGVCYDCIRKGQQDYYSQSLTPGCKRCGKKDEMLIGSLELGVKSHCRKCLDEVKVERERESKTRTIPISYPASSTKVSASSVKKMITSWKMVYVLNAT